MVDSNNHSSLVQRISAKCLLNVMWLAWKTGRIQVLGYEKTTPYFKNGKVLVIANHPTLIEGLVLPFVISDWRWNTDHRTPCTVADKKLFGFLMPILTPALRIIPVDREEVSAQINKQAFRVSKNILRHNGTIVLYPEGGRTCKGSSFIEHNKKRVRACSANIVKIAVRDHATIIPVWIDHGEVLKPESMVYGFLKLLLWKPITITFGHPVLFEPNNVTSSAVALSILNVGTAP